jgi:hypothetical protein
MLPVCSSSAKTSERCGGQAGEPRENEAAIVGDPSGYALGKPPMPQRPIRGGCRPCVFWGRIGRGAGRKAFE